MPKTLFFGQINWGNDPGDTPVGPFKNENHSKESGGFLGSGQSRFRWVKHQFRVVKMNKLAQNAVFGQISCRNYPGDTPVGPFKK